MQEWRFSAFLKLVMSHETYSNPFWTFKRNI